MKKKMMAGGEKSAKIKSGGIKSSTPGSRDKKKMGGSYGSSKAPMSYKKGGSKK